MSMIYAALSAKVNCPYCNFLLDSLVEFRRGMLPHRTPYSIGDSLDWIKDRSGKVKAPYTHHSNRIRFNHGSPEFPDVVVLDENVYDPNNKVKCPRCRKQLGGIAIFIKDNRICSVKPLKLRELRRLLKNCSPLVRHFKVTSKGDFVPMLKWTMNPYFIESSHSKM